MEDENGRLKRLLADGMREMIGMLPRTEASSGDMEAGPGYGQKWLPIGVTQRLTNSGLRDTINVDPETSPFAGPQLLVTESS